MLPKNQAYLCFAKAIKHLAGYLHVCAHCFPQFMCILGTRQTCFPLLKKSTANIFLLNSRTLIRIKVLAHNLFHKICAERVLHNWYDLDTPYLACGRALSGVDGFTEQGLYQ